MQKGMISRFVKETLHIRKTKKMVVNLLVKVKENC